MSGPVNIECAGLLILSSALISKTCRKVQDAPKPLQTSCKWLQDPARQNGLEDMGLQPFGRKSGASYSRTREHGV